MPNKVPSNVQVNPGVDGPQKFTELYDIDITQVDWDDTTKQYAIKYNPSPSKRGRFWELVEVTGGGGVPGGVQSDWDETNPTDLAYILNKPIIPTDVSELNDIQGLFYVLEENIQIDNYTLVLEDAGKIITMNKNTAVTLTIPNNNDVPFFVGTVINIEQGGNGIVEVVGSAGVTIDSFGGRLKLKGKIAGAYLRKIAENRWVLVGNLVP